MNPRRRIIAIVASLTVSASALADTITMNNGDHLNGTLLEISDGLVSFRTKLAGRVMMPSDQVTALNTDGFMLVAMKDKTALPGRIVTHEDEIRVIDPDGKRTTVITLTDVEQIQRIPESQPDSSTEEEAAKLAITTGYRLRTGTRDADGPTASILFEKEGAELRTRMEAEGEFTNDAHEADRYFRGEVELGTGDITKAAPTVLLELERDRNQALEMGVEAAAGLTRRLLESDVDTLDGFVGVSGRIEEHDPEPLRRNGIDSGSLAEEDRKDGELLQLDVRLRYTREIFSNTTLTERLKVQPRLDDPGEIRAELESTLSVPLTLNLNLNFEMLLDYQSDTAYDAIDRWNTSVGAGLQFQF